ncbi:hypothetical protein AS233_09005 [Enterococcus faecium]|nr:hypothetical protein AS233_09005 [Enterococcus faecium]
MKINSNPPDQIKPKIVKKEPNQPFILENLTQPTFQKNEKGTGNFFYFSVSFLGGSLPARFASYR